MADEFEIEGWEELQELLAKFPGIGLDAGEAAMEKALLFLHSKLPEYPPPPIPGTASKNWTDKQRRFFFAALRDGRIKVPYQRTGTLGRQFTERVTRDDVSVLGELGTATPYAPWVVGPDYPGQEINGQTMYQARIHQDRWWQFETTIEQNIPAASAEFLGAFATEFERRVRKAAGK